MGAEQSMREFGQGYSRAWGSHDPDEVARFFAPEGTISINGGPPTSAADSARGFMAAFPDIQVLMDGIVQKDDTWLFHWTFVGTNTGPGGAGRSVRISGYEEWTLGADGLVSKSYGHFDQEEYARQLAGG